MPHRPYRTALCALVFAAWASACSRPNATPKAEPDASRTIYLGDGFSFRLPAAYHEVTTGQGRTFRLRGGAKPSYSTVHVQRRLAGQPVGLDETFSLLLADLTRQDNFDLSSMELQVVGRSLALVYAARFSLLDVPRHQWGALLDGPQGITAVFLTAPQDGFADASLDFLAVLASLEQDSTVQGG